MPIAMQNFALTWTDANGTRRASAVAYDRRSADQRRAQLDEAGATQIKIMPVRPGELPALDPQE
ncbi:hypothetical protein [Streptomyces sasae]|uniref:hypothetical protein n=1 Tax=Streptomyces sasae TaxID=1266772 RepID=UPI00292DE7AC|nr:hypothetical protein [Streptomyces sasae]